MTIAMAIAIDKSFTLYRFELNTHIHLDYAVAAAAAANHLNDAMPFGQIAPKKIILARIKFNVIK